MSGTPIDFCVFLNIWNEIEMYQPKGVKGWRDELQDLLDENNKIVGKKNVVGHKTRDDRASYLYSFFLELRKGGFAVSPRNIKLKHIQYIFHEYEKRNLSAATIQTYITHLRAFCLWIKKAGMINDLSKFFSDPKFYRRVDQEASNEVKELRPEELCIVFHKLREREPVVYLQLLMQVAFNISRREVIHFRPQLHVIEDNIHLVDGLRGTKVKVIKIESDFQIAAIRQAKTCVGNTSKTLSIEGKTVNQSITYYRNVMTRYGITKKSLGISGHGLRTVFAEMPDLFDDGEAVVSEE